MVYEKKHLMGGKLLVLYIRNVGHLGPKSRHFSAIPNYVGHDCFIYMHSRNYGDMHSLELNITRVESSPVMSATRLIATDARNYRKYIPATGSAQASQAINNIKRNVLFSCLSCWR